MGSNLKMKPRVTFLVADTKLKSHKAAHIFKKGYGRCNIMLSDEWVKYSKQGIYPKDLATYGILIGQYNDKGEFIKEPERNPKTFGILIMDISLDPHRQLLLMVILE